MGFVVPDISGCIKQFLRLLGGTWDGRITFDPRQSVRVAFIQMSSEDPVFIELIEPVGESSPVSRSLQKGGGLHHVCIQVEDLESSLQAMRAAGCVLVRNAVPAAAFDNRPIAWIYMKEGLLVELLERR